MVPVRKSAKANQPRTRPNQVCSQSIRCVRLFSMVLPPERASWLTLPVVVRAGARRYRRAARSIRARINHAFLIEAAAHTQMMRATYTTSCTRPENIPASTGLRRPHSMVDLGHGGAGPVRHDIATQNRGGRSGHDQSGVRGVGSFHIPKGDSQVTSTIAGTRTRIAPNCPSKQACWNLSILRWAARTVTPRPNASTRASVAGSSTVSEEIPPSARVVAITVFPARPSLYHSN